MWGGWGDVSKFDTSKGINCANCPVVQELQAEIKNLDQMYNKIRHTLSNQNADLIKENEQLQRDIDGWKKMYLLRKMK